MGHPTGSYEPSDRATQRRFRVLSDVPLDYCSRGRLGRILTMERGARPHRRTLRESNLVPQLQNGRAEPHAMATTEPILLVPISMTEGSHDPHHHIAGLQSGPSRSRDREDGAWRGVLYRLRGKARYSLV